MLEIFFFVPEAYRRPAGSAFPDLGDGDHKRDKYARRADCGFPAYDLSGFPIILGAPPEKKETRIF
jgi:hypothetical protein